MPASSKKQSAKKGSKKHKKVRAIPKGSEGVIPHLVVSDARAAIAFYKKAFGAKVVMKHEMPGDSRLMHAEIQIGDRLVYLADDFPEFGGPPRTPAVLKGTPVTLHRYVEDCDKAIKKAVKAGATPTMQAMDMFWGDRYGKVLDPFGHEWSFATHLRDVTSREVKAAAKAMMSAPQGMCPEGAHGAEPSAEPVGQPVGEPVGV